MTARAEDGGPCGSGAGMARAADVAAQE